MDSFSKEEIHGSIRTYRKFRESFAEKVTIKLRYEG